MAATDAGLSNLALATYSTSTYYSTNFDGALTSYLSVPTNAAWQFGSGNFCLETWAYITSYSASGTVFFGVWGASNRGWIVSVTSTTIVLSWSTTGADFTSITATTTVALNQWNHFAFVRNGTSGFIYLNGVQVGTGSMSGVTVFNSTGPLYIGANKQDVDSPGTNFHMRGYLSNVRIVKGSPVYTGAFTPPTTQLTAITNTVLLTCNTNSYTDGSTNNFTITRVGNTGFKQFTPVLLANSSVTLSPTFSTGTLSYTFDAPANVVAITVTPTAVDPALASIKYNSNVTLTSGQANIATDGAFLTSGLSQRFVSGLLQYANAPQINTQGYSWTAEMYVNPTGNYTTVNHLFAKRVSGTATTAYNGYLQITSGFISFYNGTSEFVSTTALRANTWSHIAYTYDGSQLSIYVNGNKVYGSVIAITDNTEPLTIGGIRGYTHWMIGNISNFRFVKGYEIYTGNFTPPTSPLALTQSASTGIRAIEGAVTNGSSVFFNGSNFLNVADNPNLELGSSDFTIEGWFYLTAAQAGWTLIKKLSSYELAISSDRWVWQINAASNVILSIFTVVPRQWYHVAVVRNGTTTTLYVNGTSFASGTSVNANDNANDLQIGSPAGYISNVRLIKGTALYTSNFLVPAAPLTNVTNTSLLALRSSLTGDASNNNFTLTATGTPRLDTNMSPFNSVGAASNQFLSTALALQTVQNAYNPSLSLGQGHNNFTAEAWVYLNATPPVAPGWYIMQKGVNSTPGLEWSFGVTSTGLYFQTASGIPTGTTTSTSFTANTIPGQWMHLAITKVGTSVHIWFNGFYTGTVNGVNNLLYNASVASYVTIANSQTGATTAFNGFISNARIVYGIAVYTPDVNTRFTPSTGPLTTTQSLTSTTAAIGNASSYVVENGSSVLFNNTNDFLTFPEPPNLFNSASFNGTTRSLNTAGNAIFAAGTGDFTIEFWVYPTDSLRQDWVNILNTGNTYRIAVYYTGTSIVYAAGTTSAAITRISHTLAGSALINAWHHIALSRVSGSSRLFYDGVQVGSTFADSQNFSDTNMAFWVGKDPSGSTFMSGFVSNIRVTIGGTGLYSADFTPSTTPLTKTSQGAIASQVALLTLQNYTIVDNSNNAIAITNTGTVTTSQFNPFSLYGTGQNVTIEAWVLLSVAPTTRGWIINNSATSTGHFGVAIEANRTITVWSDSNASAVLTSSLVSVPLGTWTHIAVVFVNGIITIFVNGVRDATTVAKTTTWGSSPVGTMYIGRQASAAAQYFPGYITNLRMVYGTAVYTTKFNVPTSPLTAITNTVFLGLRSSVTLDSSTNNATITRGSGATGLLLSPMTSPFTTYIPSVSNGYSLAFGWQSGASPTDFLQANTGYGLSTQLPGDFTIESWIYMGAMPSAGASIIDTRLVTTDAGYIFYVLNTGVLRFDSSNTAILTGTTVLAPNTWYHLAAVRQNGVLRFFINGVQETTTASTTADFGIRTQSILSIGRSIAPVYWSGYLSNFRLIIGTAVYTSTFTPDTSPFGLTTSSGTNKLAVNGITTYPAVANPTGTTYSGSVYFGGGASSFVSLPNSGRFFLEAYDFTIEAWIYNTSTTTATNKVIVGYGSTADFVNYSFQFIQITPTSTTTKFIFYPTTGFSSGGAVPQITSNTVSFNGNQWYHVAVTRSGATISFYLNGVSLGLDPTSPTLNVGQMLSATSTLLTIGSGSAGQSPYFGYISNVRLFRGYAIYTGNFTPPTTALTNTQASGTNIIALNNAIPSLGNSVYFGGSDYMRAPASTTAMTTGDFTIETYYYPTSFAAVTTLFGQYTAATTALGYWNVQVTTAGIITVYYNGSTNFTASTAILVNEWVHIALVRVSGTIRLYVNGVSYGTISFATQFGLSTPSSPLYIGSTQLTGPTQYAVGYMSNLRIVKGVGVYTGAFTVPTSPLSSTQSSGTNIAAITGTSTSLLLYQDSPFTDNSTYNTIITPFGTPQYSPVFSPSYFSYPTPENANSGYFNGTTSVLSVTPGTLSGDFTIELWVYPTQTAAVNGLLSTSTQTSPCFHLWIAGGGAVTMSIDSAIGSPQIASVTPSLARANAWTHIAIVRISNVIYMYVNGQRQTTTFNKSTAFGDAGVLTIGKIASNQFMTGYISNVRLVSGTAVYSGSYFTPPYSTPLTAITNTTLLLLQTTLTKDNSINNFTVTNTATILSTYTNPYTMMKLPTLLTAQYSKDLASTTGIRDNSMYNGVVTINSTAITNYISTVSPFGVTPTLLLGQSSLTRDNSINNYQVVPNSTPNIMPYVTPFNGDAIAFNGTTQYITGTSLLNSLGGDFTIEFFMMAGPQTSAIGSLLLSRNTAYSPASTNNYYIMCEHILFSQQTISIHKVNLGGFFLGATPVCDSKWHHIAIVRINNIVKVYVDGLLDPSVQNSFSNNDIWDYSNYTIGSNPSDGGSTVAQLAYNGMLSNLRIINGVGIYTGAFTPPTSNLTTSQSSGTGVVAYTPTTPSSTGNSLITSSANSGFYINGTFGLNLYLNDYTIEFYHFLTGRPLTVSTTPCFFSNYQTYQTGSISMFAGHSSGDTTKYQIAFNGLAYSTTNWMQSVTSVIYGRWTHIAVVRRSGVTYLYINGILDSTSGTGNYNIISSTSTAFRWYLGSQGGSGTSYLSGYMSNFRVVNGVAVYNGTNTSISNFTVPTSSLSTTQSSETNIAALSNSLVSNGGAIQIMPSISGGQSIAYSILPPGTYDWTVEGYVFLNSLPTVNTWAAGSMVYFSSSSASVSDGIHCVIGQTELYVAVTNVKYGANILHGMSLYTWYHLAYVKISNIIYFYVNGVLLGRTTVPTNGTATASYIGGATTAATYAVNGYISNLRVTRLLGLYTNTFPNITSTLSTTQNTVTPVNTVLSANTSLLTFQNSIMTESSVNNFILTNNGASLVSVSSPFNGTKPSIFFNGGDYLSLASTTWPFGPGTFTVEFFIYFIAMPPVQNAIRFLMFGVNGDGNTFYVRFDSTGTVFAGNPQSGYVVINTPANSFTTNTWYHMAVVSVAGQGSIYINGVLQVGPTTMTPPAGGATAFTVGYGTQGVQFESGTFNGYFTDLRIVRNLPVYTGAFTVPTTSLALTQGSSTNINAITGTLPSNGFSLNFSGTNCLTLVGNSAFAFGTGDFTIECWFSPTSVTGTLFDTRSGATGINPLLYYTTSQLIYYVNGVAVITSGTTLLVNKTTWYHVALVRISGVSKMYLNGVQTGSSYTDTNNFTSTNTIFIGRGNDTGNAMTGYVSNLRVVKGTGLYSATFAPSFTTPLTVVTGTSLLTGQNSTIIDNSTNAFTITNVGTVTTSSTVTPFLSSTFLLMCQGSVTTDISVNKFLISMNGSIVTNTAFSPFNTTTTVAFFNGVTQYVVAPSDAAFTFGTGDFTIESYIYLVSGTTGTIFDSRTSNNSVHPVLYVSGTVRYKVAGTDVIVGSTLNISTWYHVALVRISGSTKLYVNGVQAGSTYADTNDYLIGSPDFGTGLNGENPLTGYLSNLRVIKGTGAYTARFPLLTGPLSTSQSSVTTVQAITSPAANANSVFFNGTTDFLTIVGGTTFNFGTGDWTIEGYAFSFSTANFRPLFNMYSAGYNILLRYNTNQWEFFRVNGLSTTLALSDANNAVNSWVHHAIVKRSGNIFWYINGTQVYTVANATNYADTTLVIGGYGGYFWQGFISNFRVVKGVGVYTGNFTVPTSPLTITQSAGANIAAIASGTLLLSLQNAVTNDASTNNYTLTANGAPALETTVSPFTTSSVMLLTAQSGLAVDNAVGFPITTPAGVAFQRTTTPFGVQTPTALLTLQGNVANVDVSSTNLTSIMVSLANTQTNTVFGPFNSDVPLLTFQDSIIIDNSNNRGQMTVVGAGVAPTDASPFTTTKGFTSLLIPYGYADISYANAFIANNANSALINSIYNPAVIPASLVSVLGLQTSNITLESSIYNSTFTTANTTPVSSGLSPFGTYPTSGVITLTTSTTTGIPGNKTNYANILVTAGDTVTTNAYSITITALGNIVNVITPESGALPAQSNANFIISDVANSNIAEPILLTFTGSNITPEKSLINYGIAVAPSNIDFIITDVANSNLGETLSGVYISNVSSIVIPTVRGLGQVSLANSTIFISDVANSNISETIANVTISNVSTIRSIAGSGVQPPPSPVGGTILFPTYSYTDGVPISAANVSSGGGGSVTASNQQIWYQT